MNKPLSSPTYLLADNHSREEVLLAHLKTLSLMDGNHQITLPDHPLRVLCLGDNVGLDRHANFLACARILHELQDAISERGGKLDLLAGNHEIYLLKVATGMVLFKDWLEGRTRDGESNFSGWANRSLHGIQQLEHWGTGHRVESPFQAVQRFLGRSLEQNREVLESIKAKEEWRLMEWYFERVKLVESQEGQLFLHVPPMAKLSAVMGEEAFYEGSIEKMVEKKNEAFRQSVQKALAGDLTLEGLEAHPEAPAADFMMKLFFGVQNKLRNLEDEISEARRREATPWNLLHQAGVSRVYFGHDILKGGHASFVSQLPFKLIGVETGFGKGLNPLLHEKREPAVLKLT